MFGTLYGRKHGVYLAHHLQGVQHLVFRRTGMDVLPLHLETGRSGVEVFVLQLAFVTAVHGVGILRTEPRHVEIVHPASYLLVGRETDAYLPVLHLRMRHKVFGSGHDFGHSRLVVGTEQRRPVRGDERLPLEERKLRKFGHGHRHGIVQPDIPAVVMFDNLRLHILAAHVGTRIHMGYEPYHRPVLITRRRRNRPHDIAVTVHLHLLQAERLHLLGQTGEQHLLLLGRRESRTVLVALRIEADVFQESFKQFHMHLFWLYCFP